VNDRPWTIRPYDPAIDFERACRVHDRARPLELAGSTANGPGGPGGLTPLAKDDVELAGFHASEKFVAEDDVTGRMLGFVGVDGGCVAWLYVHPKHHRRGIGRALLRHALARAGEDAWTITAAANAPAIALYRSLGFAVTKEFDGEIAGQAVRCVRLERAGGTQPPR
jgi:ribosomal protein S18 acetylase RimI-like enzyme